MVKNSKNFWRISIMLFVLGFAISAVSETYLGIAVFSVPWWTGVVPTLVLVGIKAEWIAQKLRIVK